MVFLHEDGITDLLPYGMQGAVDIAEHEEQAYQHQDAVERETERSGTAVVDQLDKIVVVDVVVQVLEI